MEENKPKAIKKQVAPAEQEPKPAVESMENAIVGQDIGDHPKTLQVSEEEFQWLLEYLNEE